MRLDQATDLRFEHTRTSSEKMEGPASAFSAGLGGEFDVTVVPILVKLPQ